MLGGRARTLAPPHSPLLVIRVTVAVVFGVRAVALDAAGAFLNSGPGAAPVVVLLVGFAHPPGVRASIYKKGERHTEVGPGPSRYRVTLTSPQRRSSISL